MRGKGGIIAGIITLVIGGTVFSVNQTDVAKNFSKDTGLTQQEAEKYVKNVTKDDMVPFDKLGSDFKTDGQEILNAATKLDCVNYNYEWEASSLSCEKGKLQLKTIGNSEIALGNAYVELASKTASTKEISTVIRLIDKLNADYNLEIVSKILDYPTIVESKKSNSYNRALLQTALESK